MDWTTRAMRTIAEFNAWHIAPDRAGDAVLCDTNHPDLGVFNDRRRDRRAAAGLPHANRATRGRQWKTSRYALAEDFARAQSAAKSGP